MHRHFYNQVSQGNPRCLEEGGDLELLRYGNIAMQKLFEQTKQMAISMNEILQMIES